MRLLDRLIVSVTNALRRLPCFGRNLHCLRCNSRVHRPLNLNFRSSTYYDDKSRTCKKSKNIICRMKSASCSALLDGSRIQPDLRCIAGKPDHALKTKTEFLKQPV